MENWNLWMNKEGVTLDFHRPLQDYVNGLADCGLVVNCIR
jgi:hypothetical protein